MPLPQKPTQHRCVVGTACCCCPHPHPPRPPRTTPLPAHPRPRQEGLPLPPPLTPPPHCHPRVPPAPCLLGCRVDFCPSCLGPSCLSVAGHVGRHSGPGWPPRQGTRWSHQHDTLPHQLMAGHLSIRHAHGHLSMAAWHMAATCTWPPQHGSMTHGGHMHMATSAWQHYTWRPHAHGHLSMAA